MAPDILVAADAPSSFVVQSGMSPLGTMSLLATFSTALAALLSLKLIFDHQRFNRHTRLRTCTLRMLWMVPIFAIDAWVCLFLERKMFNVAFLSSVVRDTYEAVVLVSFLQFLLIALGQGDDPSLPHATALAEKLLSHKPEHVKLYSPIRFIPVPPWLSQPGPGFVLGTLVGVLQYGVAMLVFLLFRIKAFVQGISSARGHALSLEADAIKTMSCGIAMYHLVLLACNLFESESTKDACHAIGMHTKFLCVKGIILFVQFQHFVITLMIRFNKVTLLPGETAEQTGDSVINFLLCMEILLFAFWHFEAYPAEEFNARAAKMALISALHESEESKNRRNFKKKQKQLEDAIEFATRAGMSRYYKMDLDSMNEALSIAQDDGRSPRRAVTDPRSRGFLRVDSRGFSCSDIHNYIRLQRLDECSASLSSKLVKVIVEDALVGHAREQLGRMTADSPLRNSVSPIRQRDADVTASIITSELHLMDTRPKFLGFFQTIRDITELWTLSRCCADAERRIREQSKIERRKLSNETLFNWFSFTRSGTLNKFEFHFLWSKCVELEILMAPDDCEDIQPHVEFEFLRLIQKSRMGQTAEMVVRRSEFDVWCDSYRLSAGQEFPSAKTAPVGWVDLIQAEKGKDYIQDLQRPLLVQSGTPVRSHEFEGTASPPRIDQVMRHSISSAGVSADASGSSWFSYIVAAQHLLDVQQRAIEHLEARNTELERENYKLNVEKRAFSSHLPSPPCDKV